MMLAVVPSRYERFSSFYPEYLRQHDHPVNRRLHVAGNVAGVVAVAGGVVARSWWPIAVAPVLVNAFHWLGHTVFQKNRPGDAGPRFYAAIASWRMAWDFFVRPESIR
jgi:hypothetical protein